MNIIKTLWEDLVEEKDVCDKHSCIIMVGGIVPASYLSAKKQKNQNVQTIPSDLGSEGIITRSN